MKRLVFTLSLVLILILSSVTVLANEIIINIDSSKVEFNDDLGYPFIDENSRTQVPFKAALTKYGAQVDWNNESRTAIATKGDMVIEVPIGENYILKNGEKISVDTAARIVNGRTFLPIRPVIEAFGSEVQWDEQLSTVVITTEPVDAKAIYFAANDKSYAWDNCNAEATFNMSADLPDETGNVQTRPVNMLMDMTIFMNPTKLKVKTAMPVSEDLLQTFMETYMTIDGDAYTQYIGVVDESGEFQWMKLTMENKMLTELMKDDMGAIEKNKALLEKYTKEVKFLGKYTEGERTLLKLKCTTSGDIYKEIFDEYSNFMSEPATDEENVTSEILKSFANMEFGDLTFTVYIDETSGEMAKMEMDLGKMLMSMIGEGAGIFGEISVEEMAALNSLKASLTVEFSNINKAEDFEIPQEALKAPEIIGMIDTEAKTESLAS